ncbi:YehS family protein [Ekhidna sp.]
MNNNDVLRRIRYTFDYGDDKIIRIFELGGKEVSREQISNWLKKDDDPDQKSIYDQDLAVFLNGFIVKHRGKKDGDQPKPEKKLNNNVVFRKLKIALNLRDEDIIHLFDLAKFEVSKHEISAIFRKPTQKQYRLCKDQFLRNFLQGLQVKHRGENKVESKPENEKKPVKRIITRPKRD